MEIISYIDLFIGALLNVMFYILMIKKIFDFEIKNNSYKKNFLLIILISIAIATINVFNKNIFKALIAIPMIAVGVYKIFDIKITKSLYCTIVSSCYLLIGELFISLILSLLSIKYDFLETNILGTTIGNILVIIATTPFMYINYVSNIFRKLQTKRINKKMLIIFFVIFLVIGSAFVFKSTVNIESIIPIVMNLIIFLVFVILLYVSYNETQKVNKISEEYNSLLNYLDKYENEIVEKRKLIHDFKNQLIIINGYAENNIKLKEYLNSIIEEQKSIKETKIVKNIDKLPKGLKGLMYYKLSQIENDINIVLNVKSKFTGFDKISSKDNRNVLKIIGVLLDNAIESSINTEDKYIQIDVSMNKGTFKMIILNSNTEKIESSKLMEPGFSTKGKNRGYGLSLVKDIIRNDNKYNILFDISKDNFKVIFTMNTKQ